MPRFQVSVGLAGNPDYRQERTVVIAQDVWERVTFDEQQLLIEDLVTEFLDEVTEASWERIPDEEHKEEPAVVQVICLNDFPYHVFVGTEQDARKRLETLKAEYFTENQANFKADFVTPEEHYKACYYWHLHQVPCSGVRM